MFKRWLLAVSTTVILLSVAAPAWAAVDGETVVTGKCTACHSIDRITEKKLNVGEWATIVDKEIQRGAQLNAEERNAAINYLSVKYGVTDPAAQSLDPQNSSQTNNATPTPSPNEQAYTGVELWQFIALGGTLLGGGFWLRRRK